MAKYRIKNPEIREFVKQVWGLETLSEDVCENIEMSLTVYCDGKHNFIRRIPIEFEEVYEYNPKAWNEYPKVKPPKEGWYRVEHDYQDEVIHRAMYWLNNCWREDPHRGVYINPNLRKNIKFKPWDDEE